MEELRSDIEIDAPPEMVWEVLTDFGSYPEWNPFIRRIEGEVSPGASLRVRMQPPGRRGMTFKPKLLKVEPNQELRWLGRLVIPGLFDGEHIFSIETSEPTHVRFHQREIFKGLLVPMLRRMLQDTRRGFDEMNRALKLRVEAQSAKSE
jgi:hypothetical protein